MRYCLSLTVLFHLSTMADSVIHSVSSYLFGIPVL